MALSNRKTSNTAITQRLPTTESTLTTLFLHLFNEKGISLLILSYCHDWYIQHYIDVNCFLLRKTIPRPLKHLHPKTLYTAFYRENKKAFQQFKRALCTTTQDKKIDADHIKFKEWQLRHATTEIASVAQELKANKKNRSIFFLEATSKNTVLFFKAAEILHHTPRFALIAMNHTLPNGQIVQMTALQKTIYSLDSRLRNAIIKNPYLSKAEIKRQLQKYVNRCQQEQRLLFVDMTRWNKAYQDVQNLPIKTEKDLKDADKKAVQLIGGAQKDMISQAPNIFPHPFCSDLPLSSCCNFTTMLTHVTERSTSALNSHFDRINLTPDSPLGTEFYITSGRGGAYTCNTILHSCIRDDFNAIDAYVKNEIDSVLTLFKEYQIDFPVELATTVQPEGWFGRCLVM